MKKGLSVCISCLLVLMLSVSFSLPVYAYDVVDQFCYTDNVEKSASVISNDFIRIQIPSRVDSQSDVEPYNFSGTHDIVFRFSDNVLGEQSAFERVSSSDFDYFALWGALKYTLEPSVYFYGLDSGVSGSVSAQVDSVDMVIGGHTFPLTLHSNGTVFIDFGTEYYPVIYLGHSISFILHCSYSGYVLRYDTSSSPTPASVRLSSTLSTQYKSLSYMDGYMWHFFDSGVVSSNDIKEQTDTLTNGFDNSGMIDTNAQLSGAIDDYDKNQDAITNDSVGFIDAVEFFNPSNSPPILAGITLCGSFLQSLFVNLGDWSSVVLVSLSLTFGLMLVGWFKFRK